MCLFVTLLVAGPRFALLLWWGLQPTRFASAFSTWVIWVLGLAFVPWTTLMYVAVAPLGNIEGWDWFWLALGLLADMSSYATGGWSNRDRIPRYA
jgi:hypothetical protein